MIHKPISHPLDKLINDQRLFLLEAIIPFIENSMRAPLVMYIKISELQEIMNALRNDNYVDKCDFSKDFNNQDDVLNALNQCGYNDIAKQMSQLKSAMNMMNIMNMMNEDSDIQQENQEWNQQKTSPNIDEQYTEYNSENTLNNIMNILEEYDHSIS